MRKTEQRRNRAGGSLVEFALVLPLLFILIANVVNFAGFFYAFVEVGNAMRSAGDYAVMGSAAYSGTDGGGAAEPDLTAPATAPGTTGVQLVANMLATDMQSLPNASSINVRMCYLDQTTSATACNYCANTGSSPTMSCTAGSSGPFAASSIADNTTGEGGQFTMTWVDVNYTYNPIIATGFSFPGLGLGLTLPSNLVVHTQSIYRVLN